MHPNVEAHLRRASIPFKIWNHSNFAEPVASPTDFARALGYQIERITKSLFLAASGDRYVVAVCPINARCDFSALSSLLGWGRLEFASPYDLKRVTDYPNQGVSPFGLNITVIVDESALRFDTVLVGAGIAGVEIEVAPDALVELTSAMVAHFGHT